MGFRITQLDQARTVMLLTSAGLALFATVFAGVNLFKLTGTAAVIKAIADIDTPMPSIATSVVQGTQTDYQKIADRLHVLHPGITVSPNQNSITISSSSAQSYQSWRLALSETRSNDPGLEWNLRQLCAGNCPGGYFNAEVTISRSAIEVKN